jgi:phosphatidylinositol N-acetylglucosaminyltransferase subunit Q
MGVSTRFKLSTKLARVLGMVSLNAIQVYSTIWYFIGITALGYIPVLFIIVGISFELSLQLVLVIDLVKFVTLHVVTLH